MKSLAIIICILLSPSIGFSQSFTTQEYKNFLNQNSGLNTAGLLGLYPVDTYQPYLPSAFQTASFADSVQKYYRLNADEIAALQQNGILVTDRIRYQSFGEALVTMYKRDLPLYFTADIVLHGLHKSYVSILEEIEGSYIRPNLRTMLSGMHAQIKAKALAGSIPESMMQAYRDADLYLAVPLYLLNRNPTLAFAENAEAYAELLRGIESKSPKEIRLFGVIPRMLDFSQFTPRGHYVEAGMSDYFQAMIWLGRTELWMTPPKNTIPQPSAADRFADGQRQTLLSYLLQDLLVSSNGMTAYGHINEVIEFLVGEQDNMTFAHLDQVRNALGIHNYTQLTDSLVFAGFLDWVEENQPGNQRINSQILIRNMSSEEPTEPSLAFLFMGQRFIVDSFVFHNLTFDRLGDDKRMLPKGADVLFSMGNNDAALLLKEDMDQYPSYPLKLASSRFLIDSYGTDFWQESVFNLWLNGIRSLNPPEDRTNRPAFMQSEAWARRIMNTQLSSWSQLRHDNILYAKQSYSAGVVCEFPRLIVEPYPEFFDAMAVLADVTKERMNELNAVTSSSVFQYLGGYFTRFGNINRTLAGLARKQLNGEKKSNEDWAFIQQMIYEAPDCGGPILTGWVTQLFIQGESAFLKPDYIIADVHTAPTDAAGGPVGWVYHVGTGPVNLAVLLTEDEDGVMTSFVGPVMSYYEYVSMNFKRFTDQEWSAAFETTSQQEFRPEFSQSFLHTENTWYYDSRHFVVSVPEDGPRPETGFKLDGNYPNPFNNGTVITFQVPSRLAHEPVELTIHTVDGRLLTTLLNQRLPSGTYSVRWEAQAASGVYIYSVKVGSEIRTGKMTLVK